MNNIRTRAGLVLSAFVAAVLVGASALTNGVSAAGAVTSVTISGATHAVTGTNIRRTTDSLVLYTPAFGARTGTNAFGFEAKVVGGKVTVAQDGVGNMAIPANGYVLSGHGTSRTWLRNHAKVGVTVTANSDGTPPPTSSALLPDVGIRTLRLFTIVNTGGKKLLKFPGVTANVGKGPLEVVAHRSSSTSTDWAATQHIFNTNGTKTNVAAPGLGFYYAGDGHNHWHMRDFDSYELFDPSGTRLAVGEKHGFCFEDNTDYRDWPSTGHNGAPANEVYSPSNVCGVGQPSTLDIMHGLSVGWSDTYPSTLPDQAIDITGIPDGNYKVKVTADADNNIREISEANNAATAMIQISGNTVTLLSATDGL